MSEEKKVIELNDEELEKVTGGRKLNIGDVFGVSESYPSEYNGEWFQKSNELDMAYNVCSSVEYGSSFVANRYWYNGNEAWNYGTCSIGTDVSNLHVVQTPTIIHIEFTGTKPF